MNRPSVAVAAVGAVLASNQKLYIVPQRSALLLMFCWKVSGLCQVTAPLATLLTHGALEYGSPEW